MKPVGLIADLKSVASMRRSRTPPRRRTTTVETLVLVACLLLTVPSTLNGSGGAVVADRRRGRGGSIAPPGLLARVPCPDQSCRCRLTKLGDPIARCRGIPSAASSDVVYAEVVVKGTNITRLQAFSFTNLTVRSLDLSGNHLSGSDAVDVNAFDGLETTLEVLAMSGCGLTCLPSEPLSRLCRLQILRLEANAITDVPARVLSECGSSLRELYVYRNLIINVDTDAFVGLSGLEKLSLAENRIETLPAGLFATLMNLTSLDLAHNRISRLSDGWLDGLSRLRWLQLDSNRLVELGPDTFRGASALRAMRVENNPLTTIGRRTFRPIRRLDYLSIDLSRVTPLSRRTLAGLRRLKTLSLGEIGHSNLPDRVFSGARRLKYLSLSNFDGVLDANAALRPSLFNRRFRFRHLNVWLQPMRQCRCTEPWIRALGALGTYVHGYCSDERPLSCPAPGKKLRSSENSGRRRVASMSAANAWRRLR